MHAFNLHAQPLPLAERLADFAVEALIDEADLSPKPALVDRRGNGAHSDLHLGLMHASALSLWPMFKEMAEAAIASQATNVWRKEMLCPEETLWRAGLPAFDGEAVANPGSPVCLMPRVIRFWGRFAPQRGQARSPQYGGLPQHPCLPQQDCSPQQAASPHSEIIINLSLREALGRIGREGEQAMLQTTGGVNTHRGAIWALGLLVAAAALDPNAVSANALTLRAARLALLEDRYAPHGSSHGSQVAQRYGARGAREEAQLGFPAVTRLGLPQLKRSRLAGHGEQNARLDALLAIMTSLADTCVLYRAGVPGLQAMQQGARAVLEAGGSASLAGRRSLHELDQQLLAMNASPGGAADLLAACLLIDRLEQEAL
ncbi:triphosphoribosyl-dephospho-CoA synthase [Pseudomonas gingeri]|uniref:Probable 2-(5''-triphosphoribosyl)-3'-dephosphocoenzyme-A synthase n=2 Tax=Pseudomonas gingeri TaxID=117681 RepID=A0A7Y7YH99_9PSED|nr:triphosphoribosyl-dephospho-CoA synthase [Pseudomonas gingeri]NWA01100.1 triphosphoribosyl-dephospho-CoA synthase [Pseudomonas gingeri]NWA15335.1 triphosphoribosyl-dephospho-CoA synthase [Pseudomonas gingeri]NWA53542.1 triphosphoribosyl-dephospho-CoA synthase [Pseudomonas gingeri]NWA99197.1 triphosphoribosyl-dephospho-CoA synthase [Pseudomonas gingeri]NWB03953.1 triphosphoribosyl-dephospho-CoA synthase [Pseudomonas gingeri]